MGASAGAQAPATAAPGAGATTGATTPPATTGADLPPSFVEKLPLAFEDHPYLVDHSIIRQPKGWEFPEDLNLVVPLTMTIELLAEIAKRHAPGRKLIRAGKIMAYRWIALENSFEGDLEGTWKNPDLLELNLKGYAKAEFSFGDEWPEPPSEYQGEIDIGDRIMDNLPVEVLYERYSFHGPQYHSSTKMLKASKRGMISHAKKREGKGSLLDIMGQQLGLFLHLSQTENTVSFPVRLKELNFYADILDQEGAFEHTMIVTRLTDSNITADMVLKRDGKIWSVARDFVCQRFQSNIPVWHVILRPHTSKLAEEIAPSVYFYSNINEGNVLTLLFKRYFNTPDRAEAEKLGTQARIREHLGSRITLKDAVRDFARRRQGVGEMVYPIEIFISHDEKGKLLVRGHGRAKALLDGIQVSLSHKGDESVAIVANEPVGIDLERIEEKSDGFKEMAITERERALLAELPQPEAPIQFWVAKEASAKKAGTGLEGNPRRFEVTAVDGDVLSVGDQKVQTARIGEEYVVGWTL
jgi:phosphopantetheinyl transferase